MACRFLSNDISDCWKGLLSSKETDMLEVTGD